MRSWAGQRGECHPRHEPRSLRACGAPSRIEVVPQQHPPRSALARDDRDTGARAVATERPKSDRRPVGRPRRAALPSGVVGQAGERAPVLASGIRDHEFSACAAGPMVDPHERKSASVARPRREDQLVIMRAGAWPDQDVVATAIRSNRCQTSPWMRASPSPSEDDRAPVRRPCRMDALGCSATCAEASQAASIGIDDPEARTSARLHTSAEDDLAVTGPPAHT